MTDDAKHGDYDDLFEYGDYFGEFVDDYDLDAITNDYGDAVNKLLPGDFTLAGSELYGPRGVDTPDVRALAASVDFEAIAKRHDRWNVEFANRQEAAQFMVELGYTAEFTAYALDQSAEMSMSVVYGYQARGCASMWRASYEGRVYTESPTMDPTARGRAVAAGDPPEF